VETVMVAGLEKRAAEIRLLARRSLEASGLCQTFQNRQIQPKILIFRKTLRFNGMQLSLFV